MNEKANRGETPGRKARGLKRATAMPAQPPTISISYLLKGERNDGTQTSEKTPERSLKMTGRRGLSLFLSLVMMISLVQIGAFAAGSNAIEDQEKAQIIQEGGTVYYLSLIHIYPGGRTT